MTFEEIENAFFYVSGASPGENSAVVHRVTGETFYYSFMTDEGNLPDDVEENDDYLDIPHKNDLDLGKPLVMEFVRQQCPEELGRIYSTFSRSGAYRRYKEFLEAKGLLETWYDFESRRTREALLAWCSENALVVEEKEHQ